MDNLRVKPVALLVPIVGAAAILLLPIGAEPAGRRALAIATWMVLSWLLEPLHPAIVGLGGCFLFWATNTVGFESAFAGFGTEVPWFVYGALALVSAVQVTRLDATIGGLFPRAVAGSFVTASVTITLLGLLLGLVIPSAAARAVLLVVVALGVSQQLDTRVRVTSRLPLVAVASYAAAVLGGDGAVPAPALAWRLLTVVAVIAVASRFVARADASTPVEPPTGAGAGPVAALLALVTLAWVTTSVHGVSPALVGLAAGCLVLVPGFRPGGELKVDSMAVVVAGAAISIPLVLHETKAAESLIAGLNGWLASSGTLLPARTAAYLGYVGTALFGPPVAVAGGGVATFAATTGLSATALRTLATCASTAKLGLYQSPALIVGAAVGGFTTRDILKFGVVLVVLGAIAAMVLSPS